MSRKKVEHFVVNEGRTGRMIGRRMLRNTLGNPKTRAKKLNEQLEQAFATGVRFGAEVQKAKILNAAAGLTYEEEVVNAEVVDPPVPVPVVADLGPVIPSPAEYFTPRCTEGDREA